MYSRKCPGDREVLREVLLQDGYGVEKLDNKNFTPDVVVDIGANIGAFSAMASKYWPKASLIAYEPHPLSFGLYNQNLRKHQGPVEAVLGAVSGRDLPNSFLQISAEADTDAPQCWDLNQKSERVRPDPETQGYCETRVYDINSILDPIAPGQKVLLKIDCEGSEFYIIEGISEENLAKVDVLLMEVHGSQLQIPDYIETTWEAFRERVLAGFECPELKAKETVDREHFVIRAFRK